MDKEKLTDFLDRQTFAYHEMQPESPEDYTAEYKKGYNEGLIFAIAYIDQLDEPEVLSPDWIKDNQSIWPTAHGVDYYVPAKKLFGLIVPKQEESELLKQIDKLADFIMSEVEGEPSRNEGAVDAAIRIIKEKTIQKPTIPQFVGEYIQECKAPVKQARGKKSLYAALDSMPKKVSEWLLFDVKEFGQDIFARAWLDGYTVEEKKYYVKEPTTGQFLIKDNQQSNGVKWVDGFSSNPESYTEKEIKDIDERFWPFAVPVEEEDE